MLLALTGWGAVTAHAAAFWIWAEGPGTREAAQIRRSFEVTQTVKEAVLVATCDNGAHLFLDGEEVLVNGDWNEPSKVDLSNKLKPGKHALRADCKNEGDTSGFVARLTYKSADGKETVLETDSSWEAVAPGRSDWKPVKVVGKYGDQPWGEALAKVGGPMVPPTATSPSDIQIHPGFKVELIYAVPKSVQGSWVSMTVDNKGRMVACDQGGGLYRLTLAAPGSSSPATVERLTNSVGGAHGLLYAFDSLYVMVNEQNGRQGLWRLRDTNGDDQYDEEKQLRHIDGGGEHGPHGIVLSPDGKSLYVACGNHTKLPDHMEPMATREASWLPVVISAKRIRTGRFSSW